MVEETCEELDGKGGRAPTYRYLQAHRVFSNGGNESRDVDGLMGGHLLETTTTSPRR